MSENTPDAPQPGAYPPPAPGYGAPPAAPAYGTPPPYGAPAQAPAYGAAPGYGYGYGAPAKTDTLSIVSLVSGILGLTFLPFLGSIVAVITGHMSLNRLKTSGEQGRGLALGGTITGWVGLGLCMLLAVGIIFFFAVVAANYPEYRAS